MTIYFAEMGEWLKIGYTAGTPARRISQLQTGQPQKISLLGTIPGERDAETGLHEIFALFRGNGEWFCRSEVISTVQFLIENQHPWYFARTKAIKVREWEYAFTPKSETDLSAYEDVDAKPPLGGKRVSDRIRKHRKEHGKDREWESRLIKNITTHPYVLAWERLNTSFDRAA